MPVRDAKDPFAEFIAAFLVTKKRSKELGPKSLIDYERYLNQFDEATGRVSLKDALTLENAQTWIAKKSEQGPWAAKNAAAYLKSFDAWVHKSRYLSGPGGVSALHHLHAGHPEPPVHKAFNEAEFAAIWKVLSERPNRERYRSIAYVRLLDDTGLRRQEASSLPLDALRLTSSNRGSVKVRVSGDKYEVRRLDGKTVAAIRDYIKHERPRYVGKDDEPLFLTEKGSRFRPDGFGSWIGRIAIHIKKATGITWSSRLMRHTWKEAADEVIRDEDLRRRCSDLLAAEGDYDRAVREACTVLEDRVRAVIGAPTALTGARLMDEALWGSSISLRLSDHDGEQEGAWQMYRGLMGFYRNPVGHRLRDDLDRNEALHVVSWIDHLLWLIEPSAEDGTAQATSGKTGRITGPPRGNPASSASLRRP